MASSPPPPLPPSPSSSPPPALPPRSKWRRCRYCPTVLCDRNDRLYHELWNHADATKRGDEASASDTDELLCTTPPSDAVLPLQMHWAARAPAAEALHPELLPDRQWRRDPHKYNGGDAAAHQVNTDMRQQHAQQQQQQQQQQQRATEVDDGEDAYVGDDDDHDEDEESAAAELSLESAPWAARNLNIEQQRKLVNASWAKAKSERTSRHKIPKELFDVVIDWLGLESSPTKLKTRTLLLMAFLQLPPAQEWQFAAEMALEYWTSHPSSSSKEVDVKVPRRMLLLFRDSCGIYHTYRVLYAAILWGWRYGVPCLGLSPRPDLLEMAQKLNSNQQDL